MQSHAALHLSSLDYFRGCPSDPRYESTTVRSVHEALIQHYIQAYQVRLSAQALCDLVGKMPHVADSSGGVSTRRHDNIHNLTLATEG
jgi:hypothetical protein